MLSFCINIYVLYRNHKKDAQRIEVPIIPVPCRGISLCNSAALLLLSPSRAKIGFKAMVLYSHRPLQPLTHAPYCDTNVSLISCLQDFQLLMLQLPVQQPALFNTPQESAQLLKKQLLHLQAHLKIKMPQEKLIPPSGKIMSPHFFLLPAHKIHKKCLEHGRGKKKKKKKNL